MRRAHLVGLLVVPLTLLAFGCKTPPRSHRAIQVDVTNYNQAVDVTADVLRTYFDIDAIERGVPVSYVRVKPQERREMERPELRTGNAKITKLKERVAEIEMTVWLQKDESDTGYGTTSAANPVWGEKTPDSTTERKILLEIQALFDRMK